MLCKSTFELLVLHLASADFAQSLSECLSLSVFLTGFCGGIWMIRGGGGGGGGGRFFIVSESCVKFLKHYTGDQYAVRA